MTIQQIDKMVKNRHLLTEEEKHQVRDAIVNNPKAREKAVRGALLSGNMELAIRLTLGICA